MTSYKVILVDDEQWNRDLIRTFGQWEQLGLQIVGEAEDGEAALKLVEETRADIVITDMRMPGMDGVQLMEQMHVRFPAVRMIVISGYDDFNYMKQAIRYRAVDYLLKPIDPKELNTILQKCAADLAAATQSRALPLELSRAIASARQLLHRHFNELNLAGIEHVLELLKADLGEALAQPAHLERVVTDLLLALKDMMNANSLPDDERAAAGSEVFSTAGKAVDFIKEQYRHALEQLIASRKYKNKLNLEDVRQYIERHFAENLSLEQLAKAFFVSKEYLSKVFKQEFGRNLTDYILGLRMEKAKVWLLDEQLSIKAVAEMIGYEDVTYFYRVFKKHYGVAPGEMRKNREV
ncbi:two-component system response regulator YesN [Paenibacillus phyllosphaerae]|uniref:Two-component system response regulator YesN n=1 Tax=Paenibacillus phyllosphaerae TaxID=274593 RepID=A0A7W5B1R1_9BACL|nr:response regulator [Paenibacillus phyllosphaerae]MBB3112822.1 two-component system response regulator YesN [Paenibacillus phyllosphaerae]